MEITQDCEIIVRAPLHLNDKSIAEFVEKHKSWIDKNYRKTVEKSQIKKQIIGNKDELMKKAAEILPGRVEYFSNITGLKPASVKITAAARRFGSCSSKNTICFSYMLMHYPSEAIDYVVLHEIAHIKYHNHSADFYGFIGKYMPDYKQREKLLK